MAFTLQRNFWRALKQKCLDPFAVKLAKRKTLYLVKGRCNIIRVVLFFKSHHGKRYDFIDNVLKLIL